MIFAFLVLAVTITGCTTPVILQQRVVEAEKIVLKDASGNVRLQIAVDEGGGIVQTFLDAKGTERLKLMVDAENVVRERFFDEKGKIRMSNYVYREDHHKFAKSVGTQISYPDGTPALQSFIDTDSSVHQTMSDQKGFDRVMSFIYPDDHKFPGLIGTKLGYKNGENAHALSIDSDRVMQQTFWDENGNPRLGSYVKPADHPKNAGSAGTEWINTVNGGARMRIRTTSAGNADHEFFDNNNTQRIALSLSKDGVADEHFRDAAGAIRTQTYTKGKDASFNLFDTQNRLRFNTTSFQNGSVVQSFLSDTGENKASTTVASDGTVTHYLEKGALEKIWDNRNLILMGVEMWRRFNSDK